MSRKIGIAMAMVLAAVSILAAAGPAAASSGGGAQASDVYSEPLTVAELNRVARQKWPGSYGGLWVLKRKGKPIKVAFTGGAKAKVALLVPIFNNGNRQLIPITVKRSLKTLARQQKKVVRDLKKVKKGKLRLPGVKKGKYGIGPVVKRNVLQLQAPWVNGRTKKTFKKRYPKWVVAKRGPAKKPH